MRTALFIIIIFLSQIIGDTEIMNPGWRYLLCGIGWGLLFYDYFESKKKKRESKNV